MSATFRVALAGQTVPFRFSTINFAGIRELVAADVEQDISARAATAQNLGDLADREAATGNLLFRRSATARTRSVADMLGAVVNVQEFVVGDGVTDDTAAYQALMNLPYREYFYPEGCWIKVTSQVLWNGERTHRFANDAGIIGDVANYAVLGLGYPDLLACVVASPITRGASSFTVDALDGLAVGDDFYLYDVGTEEYDPNVVRSISGAGPYTVTTKRPINYAFATAANIRVYGLTNACRNVRVIGGEFRNINASLSAHGLGFKNATDIRLENVVARDTGGIGVGFEIAMRWQANGVSAIDTGAVGLGCRNVKDFAINNFIGRNPGVDESIAFYKNITHGSIDAPDIEQYLSGEEPAGNNGNAGNCILLDERCCDITINSPRLRGSATYAIFIFNGSDRNRVINPDISLANLGGVRIATNSNDNYVGGGWITDVTDATDSEQGGIATAAIQDDNTCSGNVLGDGTRFARITSGVNVRQSGSAPAAAGTKVRGAMVKKSADETAANYSTPAMIAWNAEVYDTNAIHDNATNNTRLTVPSGVSFVEVGCTLALDNVASGTVYTLLLFKNGSAAYDGFAGCSETTTSVPDPHINVASGPIAVTAGDYFEWRFYCDDSSISVVAARSNAWMRLLD